MKAFDRKFGKDFLSTVPASPGTYLVYDAAGELIYVGKAKNLKRRLSQYRLAKRLKRHRKMKRIIAEAARIELEIAPSELEACLREARLIQERRPRWNVAGAFCFMYPLIGIACSDDGIARFCCTSSPGNNPGYSYQGAYRSRQLTRDAFFGLMRLLAYIGHPVPRKQLPRAERFTYLFAFRRIPPEWLTGLQRFFRGESLAAFEELVLALVENAGARARREQVQEDLDALKRFWKHEALPLAAAREHSRYEAWPVPQSERDLIFLKRRYGQGVQAPPVQL